MRLVDDGQKLTFRLKKVHQRKRRSAGFTKFQVAGIVFDAVSVAGFLEHRHVALGAIFETISFEE